MSTTLEQPPTPGIERPYVFHFIPRLKHLLPRKRGLAGLVYYQVPVTKLREAQDGGWREIQNTVVYTIQGPKGSIDMKLVGRGKMIPGQPWNSGRRRCFIHREVEEITGLKAHEESSDGEVPQPKEQVQETGGPPAQQSKPSQPQSAVKAQTGAAVGKSESKE